MLGERATEQTSDMVLLPWSESGSLSEVATAPFGEGAHSTFSNASYNAFVYNFFQSVPCHAAVFINNGFGAIPREEPWPLSIVATNLSLQSQATAPLGDLSHHIFLPYMGSTDDRMALRFVLRLARNPCVTATILHVRGITPSEVKMTSSDVPDGDGDAFFQSMADSLPEEQQLRVMFDAIDTHSTADDCVERAKAEVGQWPKNAGDLVVLGRGQRGRSLHDGAEGLKGDVDHSLSPMASAMISGNVKASILVIQAAQKTF